MEFDTNPEQDTSEGKGTIEAIAVTATRTAMDPDQMTFDDEPNPDQLTL